MTDEELFKGFIQLAHHYPLHITKSYHSCDNCISQWHLELYYHLGKTCVPELKQKCERYKYHKIYDGQTERDVIEKACKDLGYPHGDD